MKHPPEIANRLFFFLTVFAFLLGQSVSAKEKIRLVATTTDIGYIAKELAKDKVEVEVLIRGYDDPHFVMTRPDFILKLNQADIFCMIGLDLEIGWAPLILEQSRNQSIQKGQMGYCDTSIGINILGKPTIAIDRSMGDLHIYGNPHYWLDPVNVIQMAFNITNNLKMVDPDNETFYQENFQSFKKRMVDLVKTEMKQFEPFFGSKVAVFHQEFVYLANRFKFNANLSIEERPGIPPSSRYLEDVIKTMNAQKIKVILISPVNNPKYAEFVASKVPGSVVLSMPTSVGSMPEAKTYEDSIRIMMSQLRKALSSP